MSGSTCGSGRPDAGSWGIGPPARRFVVPAIVIAFSALPVIAGLLVALTRMETLLTTDKSRTRPR